MSNSVAYRCKQAGINRLTYYARLRLGWSEEKALSTPVRPRRSISRKGIGQDLARAGLSNVTYQSRRQRGWSEEKASTVPVGSVRGRKPQVVMPDGQAAVQVAERNGVDRRTFYRRILQGVPADLAVLPLLGNEGKD